LWNKLDKVITEVTALYNQKFYPDIAKQCKELGYDTTPLDPSLVKAVMFKETQIGTYEKWVAQFDGLLDKYNQWAKDYNAWAAGDKKKKAPTQPYAFYLLNIGQVTDASLYKSVNEKYGIGRTDADAWAADKTKDVQMTVGALLEKLLTTCQNLSEKKKDSKAFSDLDAKDPLWKNTVLRYNGGGPKAKAYANAVWKLYSQGINPYNTDAKVW
jgi:hypothetical protein